MKHSVARVPNHPICGAMSGPRWHVIHLEKFGGTLASRELAEAGFIAYFPLILEKQRQKPARLLSKHQRAGAPLYVMKHVPLFPGYAFVQFDLVSDPWQRILALPGVKGIISHVFNRPTPVPDAQVAFFQDRDGDRLSLRSVQPLIEAGARVAPEAGPFMGHAGECLWSTDTRVRVLLSIMGCGIEVEMSRMDVRVVA